MNGAKSKSTMKKKLPRFRSDKEAERLVEKADLTEYDLSEMPPIRFEFQPKSEQVNMRLPRQLLDAVRSSAAKAGVPYERFIRQALEEAVQKTPAIASFKFIGAGRSNQRGLAPISERHDEALAEIKPRRGSR